jgi:GT2 family glycosyltransferase
VTRPPVTVVVATRDRPELLADCVRALAAALGAGDELVVVEAGDSGASAALAAAADAAGGPSTRLVAVPGGGKSRQLNAGVAVAAAPLLLFTDDDCRVPGDWADALAVALDDPAVGIAFGPIEGLTHVPGAAGAAGPPPGEAPLATWTYAHGASFAARRDAVVDVGGFDERLGPGARAHGEEHDLLLRLREAGWRAVIADAPPVAHAAWRDEAAESANALVYERGSGAFLGAAIRRSPRAAWPLLKHRLGYQRQLRRESPFGRRALRAFAGGLAYGLGRRPWGPGRSRALSGAGAPPPGPGPTGTGT